MSVADIKARLLAHLSWDLRYVCAHEVKAGDYLVSLGDLIQVHRVRTFEPYDSVQIKAGKINYAKRKTDSVCILQMPA